MYVPIEHEHLISYVPIEHEHLISYVPIEHEHLISYTDRQCGTFCFHFIT